MEEVDYILPVNYLSLKKEGVGVTRLCIGYLRIQNHAKRKPLTSIHITKTYNQYWVSFCHQDGQEKEINSNQSQLQKLSKKSEKELLTQIV